MEDQFLSFLKVINLFAFVKESDVLSIKIADQPWMHQVLDEFKNQVSPNSDVSKLWKFVVPKLSPDGMSCSIKHEMEPEPFNLALEAHGITDKVEDLSTHPLTIRQTHLYNTVNSVQQQTQVDWFGIYRKINYKGQPVLVKEAYYGEPSRPIFPLTKEFVEISNNSWVGTHSKVKVIQNVDSYEGPYYECSNKVKSELCVPIINPSTNDVIGIIDAESWKDNHFTTERILIILSAAFQLGIINLGM